MNDSFSFFYYALLKVCAVIMDKADTEQHDGGA
jgi:hypothetical protein